MNYPAFLLFISSVVSLASGLAVPVKRDGNVTDIDVLNFALTLEYLEATFYHDALEKFSVDDFAAAGYPASVRSRFIEVAAHEKTHVEGIVGVIKGLKGTPTAKCTYNFPYKDPVGFVGLSAALETIGSSGYSGAAQFITDKAYLTVAASILSVESRHSSWVDGSVQGHNPWSGPFEVTLTPNQVFTLANGFIASCPSTNPPLPAKANPTLALSEGACPGAIATLTYDGTSSGVFLVFLTSNGPVSTPIHNDKTAKIPDGLKGTLFAFVSKAKDKADDENVVAGPALIMWPYDSEGNLIAQH